MMFKKQTRQQNSVAAFVLEFVLKLEFMMGGIFLINMRKKTCLYMYILKELKELCAPTINFCVCHLYLHCYLPSLCSLSADPPVVVCFLSFCSQLLFLFLGPPAFICPYSIWSGLFLLSFVHHYADKRMKEALYPFYDSGFTVLCSTLCSVWT